MIALVIHEDGSRRLVSGNTWNDISLKMSCADITVTIIADIDFDLHKELKKVISDFAKEISID